MILNSTRMCFAACRYMAKRYADRKSISAVEIAEACNFNHRSILPSLNRLVKAGVLRSQVGGSSPGFAFSRDPRSIMILEVLVALQGRFSFDCCKRVLCSFECETKSVDDCPIADVMNEALGGIERKLGKMSIWEFSQRA